MDRTTRWLADWLADDWRRECAIKREDERRIAQRALDTASGQRRYKRAARRAVSRFVAAEAALPPWPYQLRANAKRLTGRAKAERDEFVISWLRGASFDLRRDMIAALALALDVPEITVTGIWKSNACRISPRRCHGYGCGRLVLNVKRDENDDLLCDRCQKP